MNRIKVVHIVEDLKVGGQEHVIASIVRGLDPKVFDVRVWCTQAGGQVADDLRRDGFPVEVLGLQGIRNLFHVAELRRKMQQVQVDVVHTHAWGGGLIGRFAARSAKVPVVFGHVHGIYNYVSRLHLKIDATLVKWSTGSICCSQAARHFMLSHESVPPEKLVVVYNGIDLSPFKPLAAGERAELRAKARVKPGDIVIGSVGHLETHKGHEFLVQAFRRVLETQPHARLLLVGDGRKRARLEALANELGVMHRTTFAGVRRDVPLLLALMDLFVLPSLNEALGLALIEAMASGVPVVASDVGGIPEVVKHRQTGLLAEPGSASALADAILEMISAPASAQRMRQTALQDCQRFSVETMVETIAELYTTSLDKAKREREGT